MHPRSYPSRWFAVGISLIGAAFCSVRGVAAPPETEQNVVSFVTDQDRQHWAFRPLKRPAEPLLKDKSRRGTMVDSFVLAKLESRGLTFASDADRATLIRRVSFDLLGLPPSPEDVAAFVHDGRENAYELLVERLLESPHFGERWGRHWLDNVGYVDVIGTDNDASIISLGENKWRYRDYVIRSFNTDKPFDRFLTEQLAGDELVDWRAAPHFTDEMRELLIATGLLRISADDTSSIELNLPLIQHGVLQRTGETVVSNLLGLTFNCAKCHDHKYEPISQRDYYSFLAVLQPAFNPDHWLQPAQRQMPDVSPTEKVAIEQRNGELDKQLAPVRQQLATLRRPYEERLAANKLAALPELIRDDTKAALDTPADKRNEVQKYLAGKFATVLQLKPDEVTAALSEADRATQTTLDQQIANLTAQKRNWGHWQVVYDVGVPTPMRLLQRGNHETPGSEVQPGVLSVLCSGDADAVLKSAPFAGATSGRRLALANWLTNVESPAGSLVLRVRVNRIWQNLFGKGLVETTDNFGKSGANPSHPELLEWLASEFAANGQQLKPLLKLLLTSSVYRQASSRKLDTAAVDPRDVDPDNRLLWRMPLRRLESEAVRDSILAVSGKLDRTLGGPPIPVESKPDGTFVVPEKGLPTPTSQFRRSVYLLARRNYHPTLLGVFDQPALTTNCTGRSSSAVVLQSLTMLNDPFVVQQAGFLSDRVAQSSIYTPQRIEVAFQLAVNRSAKPHELAWCVELLQRHKDYYLGEQLAVEQAEVKSLGHLCHMLLNTSEFLAVP